MFTCSVWLVHFQNYPSHTFLVDILRVLYSTGILGKNVKSGLQRHHSETVTMGVIILLSLIVKK